METMHGGQQTTLDELESKAFIDVSDAQKRKWKVEISGDICLLQLAQMRWMVEQEKK